MGKKVHIFPIAVFLLVLFYFVVLRARPMNGSTASNSFAIAATFVIGICFALGPLSRFRPHVFLSKLRYRKALGLWGFLFAAIHTVGALVIVYGTNIISVYSPSGENFWAIMAGTTALVIFLAMIITSRAKYIGSMGYIKWKRLQRTGYIAFFFVLVHFTIINKWAFVGRQLGQFLFAFVMLVLLIRILVVLMGKKEAYKPEKFYEVHEMEE